MRVAVLAYRNRTTPSADPWPSTETLASDLEASGHETAVFVVSAHGLGAVSGTTTVLVSLPPSTDALGSADLIFVHAETPIEVLVDLQRTALGPVCLYGPFAGERFGESGADFALVGPIRDAPIRLAEAIHANPSAPPLLDAIPRLLYRAGPDLRASDDWSPPRFEDWSRARTHPQQSALPVPSRALPEAPRIGILTLPGAGDVDPGRGRRIVHGWKREPDFSSSSLSVSDQIQARAVPHWDALWMSFAPLDSHPNELLDRPFSLLWDEGVRHFHLLCPRPFSAWSPWLEHLERQGTIPREVELSPSVEALRAAESGLDALLANCTRLGIRIVFSHIPFISFVDRSARLHGIERSHFETRAVARLLTHLDVRHREHDLLSREHRISFFDPWTTIEDLLDQLQVLDEDAPFLKNCLDLDSKLQIRAARSPIGRRAAGDALLQRVETGTGFDFRFADPRLERFHDLAPRGLVPLYEAVGRMRLNPQTHDQTLVEARFRWWRELALCLQPGPDSGSESEAWGRIVAGVVQSLQVDRPRRAR